MRMIVDMQTGEVTESVDIITAPLEGIPPELPEVTVEELQDKVALLTEQVQNLTEIIGGTING